MSIMQVAVRFSSMKLRLSEGTIHLYDRWRHRRSPPPQFRHGTGGDREIFSSPQCRKPSWFLLRPPTRLSDTLI
ncbi:hypothetical protein TNCV_4872041 [Trichonephila clavipes]|nr:hypothetical protein TNCV_4872041 [Trichonephila clavipes]